MLRLASQMGLADVLLCPVPRHHPMLRLQMGWLPLGLRRKLPLCALASTTGKPHSSSGRSPGRSELGLSRLGDHGLG